MTTTTDLPPRLRVVTLPNSQFIFIVDRMGDKFEPASEADLGSSLVEHLDGCGGVLIFRGEVELP